MNNVGVGQAISCSNYAVPQQVCDAVYQAYSGAGTPAAPVTVTAAANQTLNYGYATGATLSIDIPQGAALVSIQDRSTGNYQQAFGTPVVVRNNASGNIPFTVIFNDAGGNETCYINFLENGPNTPSGFQQSDLLKTLLDWAPNAVGPTFGSYTTWTPSTWTNATNTLLPSVVSFWQNIGSQNEPAILAIPANAWNFPWQYSDKTSNDPISTGLAAMLADPNAKAVLSSGQVPLFDPTKIDWTSANNTALFNYSTLPTTAGNVANVAQTFQNFVQQGAACNLFSADPSVVTNAWTQFSTGTLANPCLALVGPAPTNPTSPTGPTGPLGPLTPLPPGPSGATGPFGGYGPPYIPPGPTGPGGTTPISQTTAAPDWVGPVIAVAGIAAILGIAYILYKKENVAQNPSLNVSYSEYRAGVANQLINRYKWPYHVAARALDVDCNGKPLIETLYNEGVPVSKVASKINTALRYAQRSLVQ